MGERLVVVVSISARVSVYSSSAYKFIFVACTLRFLSSLETRVANIRDEQN